MNDGEKVIQLKEEYFRSVQYLKREYIEEFDNCSKVRLRLYIVRERLLAFIRATFGVFIKRLPDKSSSFIKQTITDNVRILDPTGKVINFAEQRREKIKALAETQFTADWRTFARCYTGFFSKSDSTYIKQSKIEDADPLALLEILKNCELFHDDLYLAAYYVIGLRHRFYGHISVLLIDSSNLVDIDRKFDTLLSKIAETQIA